LKKKLFVSFSGGETSGYMCYYLKNKRHKDFEMVFVFANTGEENEETLKFVDQCDKEFNLNVVWIEAVFNSQFGIGANYKIVNYKTASRNGEPFKDGISKLGIPNKVNPWCTRDLKQIPLHKYIKNELGWKDYYTAIGIRNDEIDRMSKNRKKNNLYYPLVSDQPMNKPKINFWWSQQKFRLQLKGYEGNCKWCWKKSDNKLMTIAVEKPEYFDFPKEMEKQFENYVPESKSESMEKPVRFFRENKSVKDIFKNSKNKFTKPKDDSDIYNYQISMFDKNLDESNGCDESCEIY
jgi:hypothetical protein